MTRWLTATVLVAAGLAAGYWLARQNPPPPPAPIERTALYFRHPMNPKVTSPTPAKDEMGMDYVPVFAEEAANGGIGKGRILYYRHPMGAADTSPLPKKDEMGMDYLPVYEGEQVEPGQVHITPEKIQTLGVKSAPTERRPLARVIRALGTIQADERRIHVVTSKFEGWINRLRVSVTGQAVRRGDPLAEVYSPELVSTQQEYLIARRGQQALAQGSELTRATAARLADSALARLRYWDIGAAQIQALQRGQASDNLTLTSPVDGVVLDKPAVAGMRFMPGENLFRIANLAGVWLVADLYEQDLGWVREGQGVNVHIKAYPDRQFKGRIGFIQPTLETSTRTVKLRIELANADGSLKPGLYGTVDLETEATAATLTIPEGAVIDSGTRQIVLVDRGEGRFETRTVKVGRSADGYTEVLDGLADGEKVVTRANFLIDAESQLKSALDSFGNQQAPDPTGHPAVPPANHKHEPQD